MLPLFFGTITSEGGLDPSAATSDNFTASRVETGKYRVTLDTWIASAPAVSVTTRIGSGGATFPCYDVAFDSTKNQYSIDIHTHDSDGRHVDREFSFVATIGSNVPIDLLSTQHVVALDAEILPFASGQQVLVLSTTIGSVVYKLDKGTALLVNVPVDSQYEQIQFTIPAEISASGVTYQLQGYTNGPGSVNPQPWSEDTWNILKPPTGARSGFDGFTVVADDGRGNVLATDPIARVRTGGSGAN